MLIYRQICCVFENTAKWIDVENTTKWINVENTTKWIDVKNTAQWIYVKKKVQLMCSVAQHQWSCQESLKTLLEVHCAHP
jgi:hypothetical protein